MAVITSYTSLQTEVANWLAKSNLTTDIPALIQMWEENFYREPKNHGSWMESALSVTIASSVAAVPDDYLELKYAYIDGSPSSRLDRKSLNQLLGAYPRGGDTGRPIYIARAASNFIFGPAPDSDYDVEGWYYAKPDALRDFAGDAAEHWLIVNAPDLVLYGTLLEAQPFLMNDKRIAVWERKYATALQSYRDLNRDEDVSGSPIQEMLA